jgi:cytochrome c-type biogenesis protein CcmH/NrfG
MTPELSGRGGAAAPGKAGIRVRRLAFVGLVALALLAIGGVLGARPATPPPHPATTPTVPGPDRLAAAIERAQQRLRLVPKDYVAWAGLGSAYLERARVTADPSYYPKAEGALDRSLRLRPQDNPDALTGLGALANARHDFAGALGWARRALRVDPYHADAYGCSPTRRPNWATPRPRPPRWRTCSTCARVWPRTRAPRTTWSSTAAWTRPVP